MVSIRRWSSRATNLSPVRHYLLSGHVESMQLPRLVHRSPGLNRAPNPLFIEHASQAIEARLLPRAP